MDQQITEKFSNGSRKQQGIGDNDQSCYAAFENNGENEFTWDRWRVLTKTPVRGWDT